MPGRLSRHPEAVQPPGQLRTERVPDLSIAWQPRVEQLVAEHQQLHGRGRYDGERVVPGRGGQAEHRRRHDGAGGQQDVTATGFLPAETDVRGRRAARGPRRARAHAGGADNRLLHRQHVRDARRDGGTCGDAHALTGTDVPVVQPSGGQVSDDPPGRRPSHAPAVHRRAVGRRQGAARDHVVGQHALHRLGQGNEDRGQRIGCCRQAAGGRPRHPAVPPVAGEQRRPVRPARHDPTRSQPRRGLRLPSASSRERYTMYGRVR